MLVLEISDTGERFFNIFAAVLENGLHKDTASSSRSTMLDSRARASNISFLESGLNAFEAHRSSKSARSRALSLGDELVVLTGYST